MATGFGPSVLAQTGQNANAIALASGTGRRVWRQVGGLLLLQMLLQELLLLELLLLLKLLLLLLDLELLVLLQILQMALRRWLLRQDCAAVLQILPAQQIELGEELLLASILLRPQRLAFLLQSVRCRRLLHQAQLHLRVSGLRRNAQQNDKQEPFDHRAPIRWSCLSTVVLQVRIIKSWVDRRTGGTAVVGRAFNPAAIPADPRRCDGARPMTLNVVLLTPLVALICGILILVVPRLLNYIVAIYLIIVGVTGLWPHFLH